MRLVRSLPHPGLRDLVGDYADFAQRADGPVETARLLRRSGARAHRGRLRDADQAHMAREFRELAGAPPTAVPFVQGEELRAA
jgi:hypothetical protein